MNNLINEPDASRLIYGLRDTGYDFNTAVADIVDNSIAANATTVNIDIELSSDGEKFVYIGDNGHGMDSETLHSAMRYGAPERENKESLGKFGLGLKTASSSICTKLTVLSKLSRYGSQAKLCWDLEHIRSVNKWEMLREPIEEHERQAWEKLCGYTGTLVVWSNCDRMLTKKYSARGGIPEKNAIKKLRQNLISHLGTIFHRFLDESDSREANLAIFVNGRRVEPWNPFAAKNSEQMLSPRQQEIIIVDEIDSDDVIGKAAIKAWILPHNAHMTVEERKVADITYKNQGFYIYREGRLINHGGWLGIFRVHGHLVQLRIEFDFGHELDEVFFVDVKKSRIRMDSELENYVEKLLTPIKREAEIRNKKVVATRTTEKTLDHSPANTSIKNTPKALKPIVKKVNLDDQSAEITNKRGAGIVIRHPILNNVDPNNIHVEAVDTIVNGNLWEPVLKSVSEEGHVPSVQINKNHDFYKKIYLNAESNGVSVQGMDLLLWAFAVAEMDSTDDKTVEMLEEIREDVSTNLRKLLKNLPMPEIDDDTDS